MTLYLAGTAKDGTGVFASEGRSPEDYGQEEKKDRKTNSLLNKLYFLNGP